jgi:hypothetical protein
MKTFKRLLAMMTLGLVAFSSAVYAEGPGWIYNVTVIALVNTSNGGVNVRVSPDLTVCVSQSGYGPKYASISPTHPSINRIKADLLTALITGTPVSLYLGDSNCTVAETVIGSP